MSSKNFCDICNKEIEWSETVRVDYRREYCKKCWYDEKNWKEIHKLKPSED